MRHGSRLHSVPQDGCLWAEGGWLPGELRKGEGTPVLGELFSKLQSTQFILKGIVSVPEQAGRKAVIQMREEGSKLLVQSRGSEPCTRRVGDVSRQVAPHAAENSNMARQPAESSAWVLNSVGKAWTSHARCSGERISAYVITV